MIGARHLRRSSARLRPAPRVYATDSRGRVASVAAFANRCDQDDRRSRPRRVRAAQQSAEVAVLDNAVKAKQLGPATGPDPGRHAVPSVVVVQPGCDLLLVVGLLA